MLKTRVIPCLDVDSGRVVKGVQFADIVDAGDPVAQAQAYDVAGADELVFLDITASAENRGTILDVVSETARNVFMPVTVGGGVRSVADVRTLLAAGADKVSVNTAAVKNPELVAEAARAVGDQCVVVAIDARAKPDGSGWEVVTHGGRSPTGLDVLDWARRMAASGAGEILLTSMDKDGARDGFDLALTKAVSEAVRIPVIASGGAGKLDHLVDAVRHGGADAVLAASIFHFGHHTIAEAKRYLADNGVAARIDPDL